MRLAFLSVLCTIAIQSAVAQTETVDFLSSGIRYNPDIRTPEQFFGFKTGELHLNYDKLLRYYEFLDKASDRISIVKIGESYEKQPLVLLVITSPENQMNLDKIRRDHLAAADPEHKGIIRGKDPLIIWLGYSIHGNEPSGANAAPLVAYHLIACEEESVTRMLDQSVILINPCLNPDGLNRFAGFINSRKSRNNNSDPLSFEFQEPWPGARSNHYWFDLNRDWLLLQHPETRAIVEQFHYWLPNVVTDHHEMGANSTFFFQPGVPQRSNPLVPPGNFALTQKIGTYHARALDKIGSLYFTEESFDDFYVGKGSSYPDLHGSVGILFEQAGSRGHLRNTNNGPLSFAFTIKNQVTVSLSTLESAFDLKKELQYYMADFFKSGMAEGTNSAVKGYVFGDARDPYRSSMMLDILLRHNIKVMNIDKRISIRGFSFDPGKAWFVPCGQPQYRLIRSLFEPALEFADSTFYDVSTWHLPLAMGIPFESVTSKEVGNDLGRTYVQVVPTVNGTMNGTENAIGYLITGSSYLIHKTVYKLLAQGIRVGLARSSFLIDFGQNRISFPPGTLFIPAQNQSVRGSDLYYLLSKCADSDGLTVYAAPTSYTPDGPDLGSNKFSYLTLPKILTFAGAGDSGITGEIWHLLDTRFEVPLTITDVNQLSQKNLNSYTTIILTGNYSFDDTAIEKLREWVRKGGVLIAVESGCNYLSKIGFLDLSPKEAAKETRNTTTKYRPYGNKSIDQSGQSIPGSIFRAELDTTHPIGYGYHTDWIAVFREGNRFYSPSTDPYENPLILTDDPLVSGYISKRNLQQVRNSSSIQRQTLGSGKIILFLDDPLFRGYWAGMHKLFLNALFWGEL